MTTAYPLPLNARGDPALIPSDQDVWFELTTDLNKGGKAHAKLRIPDRSNGREEVEDVTTSTIVQVWDRIGDFVGKVGDYGYGRVVYQAESESLHALIAIVQLKCQPA